MGISSSDSFRKWHNGCSRTGRDPTNDAALLRSGDDSLLQLFRQTTTSFHGRPTSPETPPAARPPANPVARYVLAGVLLAGALGGLLASPVLAQSPNGWLLSNGSQVAGVDVSGLSPQEASEAVAQIWEQQRETAWTLTAGDQAFDVTPATLGISAELAGVREALEAAQPPPKSTWERLTRYVDPHDPTEIKLVMYLDQPTFDAWIRTVRPKVERPVTNASIDWANKAIIPEAAGQSFDKGAWQALLDDPLHEIAPRHIELPVAPVAPAVTAASLSQVSSMSPSRNFQRASICGRLRVPTTSRLRSPNAGGRDSGPRHHQLQRDGRAANRGQWLQARAGL